MKKSSSRPALGQWWRENRVSCLVLAAALVLFLAVRAIAAPEKETAIDAAEYAEYENAVITEVLSDNTFTDPAADNALRGEQILLAEVKTGQYKGEIMQAYGYVGPLYGGQLKAGDGATLLISTYADGSHVATVYEYNRLPALAVIVALFLIATVAVGGKVGAKSLVALAMTLVCLFWILIPLLMKGAPTLLTDVEPLLQLRQTGTPLGLRGLLVGGIVISALGAVMDVAMSIASALTEVHTVAPNRNTRELFRSGMNIGRDMVGTMTNTLILAFLGSGFALIIYLYSLGLSPYQLISSSYLTIEVVSSISSSIGVILSVPLTALISSVILTRGKG